MPDPNDQDLIGSGVTILLPGEEPQGTQGTETPDGGVSQTEGATDDMAHVYEAAGVKAPEPKTAQPSSTIAPELIEALRKLDPTQLPADLQEHLDRHFQPAFTRKTQALADERRAFEQQRDRQLARIDSLLSRMGGEAQSQGHPDTKLSELRERLRSGDDDAADLFEKLVDEKVQARVRPLESSVVIREAYEMAQASEPAVARYAEQVGEVIRTNSEVQELLSIANHKFAPMAFRQIARDLDYEKLKAEVATFDGRIRDAVEKAVRADRDRVGRLPQTTTHAGTTTGVTPKPEAPKTWDEAKAKTLADLKAMGVI